ncbi:MAG: hypothetical protein B6245_06820 [Desulfobacteraceae bacterium 4572_88]|nr:MAG: hypothetical protein B6245_06820 [Desulfobacteraceae bacterium 4572_88]
MILSFHPCFVGDQNMICAGRDPGADDIAAIRAANAVILPQGCKQPLYEMARKNCPHVFPNYDAKFSHPGKIGQTHLFRETRVPHPRTLTFACADELRDSHGELPEQLPSDLPFVFKFDWGGEGSNVFLICTRGEFQDVLEKAIRFEKTGQAGFLIQEYIPGQNRALRVVVMGQNIISYWRVQENLETFQANLAKGAVIDADSDPHLQARAADAARNFCKKTGINLAGFDFLFSGDTKTETEPGTPLFLEINYFFGRTGLGGSEKFYELLNREIRKWRDNL